MNRVLICGGRDYEDYAALDRAMRMLFGYNGPPAIIIHGGATGADRLAHRWAIANGAYPAEVKALWSRDGKHAAGPKRNSAMLILQPDCCVALPGGRGTADMVRQCEKAGVPVFRPYGAESTRGIPSVV